MSLYKNIWMQGDYIYHTTASGVDVYDDDASSVIDHIEVPSPSTSVWADDSFVYIGTTAHGIYRAVVSGVAVPFAAIPNATGNRNTYIHGSGDFLCSTTSGGVDRYDLTLVPPAGRISSPHLNTNKCYQTTSGTLYYIENNSLADVDENDLGGRLRDWSYYQIINFTTTTTDDAQVRVVLDFDFPYHHTQSGGHDIRFIDNEGNNLSYYIESWYPEGRITVKVASAGSSSMYMLYGNRHASAQSDGDAAYYFHDDFSTLDSSVWSTYKGHSNNYASSNGSYVTLYDYNNSGTAIVTNEKMPYNMLIEARMRRSGPTDTNQFDGVHGYSNVHTKNRPNRGYIILCPIQAADEKLHYLHAYDTAIQGSASFSTTWYTWSAIWSKGYQMSNYRDETLELSSVSTIYDEPGQYFMFHIDNSSTNPNLNVDWVRFSSWPENITYTNVELQLWELIKPRLHVVYPRIVDWVTPDHTYDEFYGDPLYLNDIHITEGTSSHGDNTIFLASDRGAHVIDEKQGDEENADTKRYYIE